MECLLTEGSRKFLLFFDLIFVKDSAEFIKGVLRVTAQRRDVLRRILSYAIVSNDCCLHRP